MPTSIGQIEDALVSAFSGCQARSLSGGTVAVPVILGRPFFNEDDTGTYPVISIQFTDMPEAKDTRDTIEKERVSEDTSQIPFVSTLRDAPTWYWLSFQVHSWLKDDEQMDRDVVEFIATRFRESDSLRTSSGDSFYLRRGSGHSVAHQIDSGVRLYHRIWTIEVLADLVRTDRDETRKQVHQFAFSFASVETQLVNVHSGKSQSVSQSEGGRPPENQSWLILPVDEDGDYVPVSEAKIQMIDEIVYPEE